MAEGRNRRRLQTFLGVAILIVSSAFGWMLWDNYSADSFLPEIVERLPANVDLGLDRVHYSHNENGKRSWVLDADRAAYQRQEEELALTGVELVFYDAGVFGELRLTAKKGYLRQQQDLIDVEGDVRIVATSGEQFQSEALRYEFAKRLISTDAPVEMKGRKLQLTGVGMTLELASGKMRILKNVYALLDEDSIKGDSQ